MISFRIFSTDFRISFSFFMFTALVFMTNNYHSIVMFFMACAVHEAGHLVIMCVLRAEIKSVFIIGLGIRIVQSRENLVSNYRNLAILSGGIAVNLLVFLSGIFNRNFADMNLMLCIFNLLPFRNLDGGNIILCIGELLNAEYISEIVLKIFAVIMTALSFLLIYIFGFSAFPIAAVILYYCFSEIIL